MNNQVGIKDILFGVISFFQESSQILMLFSCLRCCYSIVFYHNSKKPYFETSAIAISGLYFYENYEDQKILDPQIAVEILNFVSDDVRQKTEMSYHRC